MMDTNSLLAILALIIAIAIGIFVGFFGLRQGKVEQNTKKLNELSYKIDALNQTIKADSHIIDAIAGALNSTHKRLTVIQMMTVFGAENDVFSEEENKCSVDVEKFLTELGLFSNDKERRISAQRSLAHVIGGPKSLKLMKRIEKGELGFRDTEIVEHIHLFERRIRNIISSHRNWGGRPGGGEF